MCSAVISKAILLMPPPLSPESAARKRRFSFQGGRINQTHCRHVCRRVALPRSGMTYSGPTRKSRSTIAMSSRDCAVARPHRPDRGPTALAEDLFASAADRHQRLIVLGGEGTRHLPLSSTQEGGGVLCVANC